jgi:hypothetical protein
VKKENYRKSLKGSSSVILIDKKEKRKSEGVKHEQAWSRIIG